MGVSDELFTRRRVGASIATAKQAVSGSSALVIPTNISGSDQGEPYSVIEFADPQNNGLPFWGLNNGGYTVIRKIRVSQQTGYYAQWWYSRGDGDLDPATDFFVGAHPYPTTGTNAGTTHYWEIAVAGRDIIDADGNDFGGGNPTTVTKDITYVQALTVTRQSASQKTIKFYFNLPNVDAANYVRHVETTAGYGESAIPTPKITIGDSPWFADTTPVVRQHERFGGVLDAQKVFTPALSESDSLMEASNFGFLMTSAGQAQIWWGKDGFNSIDDLTCAFGTGRSFVRNDSSNLITTTTRL
jgi:hypothetical protein